MTTLAFQLRRKAPALLVTGLFALAAVVCTYVAMQQPLIGAGLLYVAVFTTIAWYRPDVALMLIFASAPLQSDLSGDGAVKFSIAEINLCLLVPIWFIHVMLDKKNITLGPIEFFVFLHFAVCVFASVLHWRDKSLISIVQMFQYVVLAVLLYSSLLKKPEDLFLSLYALVFVGVCLACISLVLGVHFFFGLNKNGMGASLACAEVVCVELWFAAKPGKVKNLLCLSLIPMTVGLVFALSRGAWIAAIVGIAVVLGMRREFKTAARLAVMMIPLMAICWIFMPPEAKAYAFGFETDRLNISARLDSIAYAKTEFFKSPWVGVGVGLRKEYDATNIALCTLAESGVPGLVTFLLIHVAVLYMIWEAQKVVFRDEKMYSLLPIGAALCLGRLAHGMVDHYWSRGPILIDWASVGMATAVYMATRNRAMQKRQFVPVQ